MMGRDAHLKPMIGFVPQPSQVMPVWVPNPVAPVSAALWAPAVAAMVSSD